MEEQIQRRRLGLLLFLTLALVSTAFGKGFEVNFYQKSSAIQSLEYNVGDFGITEVTYGGKTFSKIDFDGTVFVDRKGFAKLPFIGATVQLAPFGDVDLKVVDSVYEDVQLEYPLLPSKGVIYRNQDPEAIPYKIAPESLVDEWYPELLAKNSTPFVFRDVRGTSVYVYPFQYNAARQTLRVYKSVTVELSATRKSSTNNLKRFGLIEPTMDQIYRTVFVNYNQGYDKRAVKLGEMGDILVIYTARDKSAIQPYIDWKRQKGFKVFEKEVSKGTNVKNIIKDEYNANKNILYVQLVGDWEDIKSDTGPSSAPMDPMLGLVEGNDYFVDLIVGRFSAKSADDVTVQVNKTINYEKKPEMNGAWYRRALGIASGEGGGSKGDDGESDKTHLEIIKNNRLLPTTYDLVHAGYAANSVTSSQIAGYLNEGVGLINYTGHGSTTSWSTSGFSTSDIKKLKNNNMLPFIVSVACVNGEFHSSTDSFAEVWLKQENGGAIGVWMSTINQPWDPPMRGQDYFNDLMIGGYDYASNPGNGTNVTEQRTTFGSLTMNAAILMYTENNGSSDLDTIKTWTVFGDASLQVRTDMPKKLSLSTSHILMGIPFEATVTTPEGPVEGALVSLYQGGKTYSALTDAYGRVVVEHELEVDEAQITVTAFNTTTISQTVNVIPPEGAYVSLESFQVIDSNNAADYGDTVQLDVVLRNLGTATSKNLVAELSTDSEFVQGIGNAVAQLSSLAAGSSTKIKKAFAVSFVKQIADQTAVPFMLTVKDDSKRKMYESKFFIVVNAPAFEYSVALNGAGSAQPGETRSLQYTIKNAGHADAQGLFASLEELNGVDLNILAGGVSVGTIKQGKSTTISFDVAFDESIATGTGALFKLSVEGDLDISTGYEHALTVGMTESFESGNFSGNNWIFSGDASWIIDQNAFDGEFAGKSGTIDHSKSSTMTLKVRFAAAGKISFYRKVSSEARYDKLKFFVDGTMKEEWSGEVEWEKVEYAVPAGLHELTWTYSKDGSVVKGDDCAWVDNILAEGGIPVK